MSCQKKNRLLVTWCNKNSQKNKINKGKLTLLIDTGSTNGLGGQLCK